MTKLAFHAPGMDTKTLSESGAPMKVYRPDGSPLTLADGKTQVVIPMYGPDSKRWRDLMREQTTERTKFMAEATRTPDQIAEFDDAQQIAFIARMVAPGWNVTLADNKPAPQDVETYEAFFGAYDVARAQADQFIGRRASFMQTS